MNLSDDGKRVDLLAPDQVRAGDVLRINQIKIKIVSVEGPRHGGAVVFTYEAQGFLTNRDQIFKYSEDQETP